MSRATEIEIQFAQNSDGTYKLEVKPDSTDPCYQKDPETACGWRGGTLKWRAGSNCEKWAVLLGPSVDVPADKRVRTSEGGNNGLKLLEKGKEKPAERVKYSVMAEDPDGDHHFLDPIVVIRDPS